MITLSGLTDKTTEKNHLAAPFPCSVASLKTFWYLLTKIVLNGDYISDLNFFFQVVGGGPIPATQRRVYGSMTGAEEDTGSLDSDSDLLLDGDGEGTDLGSEEELDVVDKLGVAPGKPQEQSDDDF